MKNKFLKFFYILFLITVTFNITIASETDNYYKNLLKKNNIHYSVYNSEMNLDEFPKNIITSNTEFIDVILENKFDNLIYICNHELDINDCLSFFVSNDSLMADLIEPISFNDDVEIYKYINLNRNVYIVPEYILMSTIYPDYLFDYLSSTSIYTQTKSFDYNFYLNIIFEIFIYLLTLFIIYNIVYLSTKKRLDFINEIKNNKYIIKNLSKISSLLLVLILLFQPFVITIYKSLYNKSIDINTLKSFYVLNIVSPRLYTSMDLVVYFVQVVNILTILLLIFVILTPFIVKYFYNSKNIKKIICLIIFSAFLLISFIISSPKDKINLFNEKSYLNKQYFLTENIIVNDINFSKLKNLFIDSYLIFNNNYSSIKNTNLNNLNNLNDNFYIIANDLNEYISTLFYLHKNQAQLFNNLTTTKSSINFYSNLSYDPNSDYYIDVNLSCKYNTKSFTFSIFIYTQYQIKSNIEPEKLDFYNFSGCNAGESVSLRLPLGKFNLYKQNSILVLRSREQESNPNIDTNGIEYDFELVKDTEIIKKISLNKYNSKIIFSNLIENNSDNLYVYSLRSNKFEITRTDFIISNIIKEMKNIGLLNNTFYMWGN